MARDHIRPGPRIIGYRRRAVIAFLVLAEVVVVVGIFYGDRDYEAVLAELEEPYPLAVHFPRELRSLANCIARHAE